jgi:hypothetical protein
VFVYLLIASFRFVNKAFHVWAYSSRSNLQTFSRELYRTWQL